MNRRFFLKRMAVAPVALALVPLLPKTAEPVVAELPTVSWREINYAYGEPIDTIEGWSAAMMAHMWDQAFVGYITPIDVHPHA